MRCLKGPNLHLEGLQIRSIRILILGLCLFIYPSTVVLAQNTPSIAIYQPTGVWFRITPHDPGGWGTPDTTIVDVDNQAPQWIAAEGTSGDSTFTFWFDD